MKKPLEKICTFADECASGDYGSLEICRENYVDCEEYKRIIRSKLERYYNEHKNPQEKSD